MTAYRLDFWSGGHANRKVIDRLVIVVHHHSAGQVPLYLPPQANGYHTAAEFYCICVYYLRSFAYLR